MTYVLTQVIWVSVTAVIFILIKSIFKQKLYSSALYILGCILALSFILPIKLPVLRLEISEGILYEFSYRSEEPISIPDTDLEDPGDDVYEPIPSPNETPARNKNQVYLVVIYIAASIYIAGVLVTIFCTVFRYRIATGALQTFVRPPTKAEKLIFEELCKKHRISHMPKLFFYTETYVESSITFGFGKQYIIIANNLKYDDLTLVLEHEIIHCKRKDSTVKAFLALIGALYWFNPAIKLFICEVNRLCEESCDEKLLQESSIEDKMRYCRLLIDTATIKGTENKTLFNAFKGGKTVMKERLKNILNTKSKTITAIILVFVLITATITSAIYFTFPKNNIKIAYFDRWDKIQCAVTEQDIVTDDYKVKYTYSMKNGEINVKGNVLGKEFDITGTIASRNHNGAKILYDCYDEKENHKILYFAAELAQFTEFEMPSETIRPGIESWNHTPYLFFKNFSENNPKYQNVILLYLNPYGTDDILAIEIFIEENFITDYQKITPVRYDSAIADKHLNWFSYWYQAHIG